MQYLNLLHRTTLALGSDVVAYTEGTEEQKQYAARQVLQVARECHTGSQTNAGQQGGEARGIYSECVDHGNDEKRSEEYVDKALHETLYREVHVALHQYLSHDFVDHADNEASHHIDDDGHQDALAGLQRKTDERFQQFG